MKRIFPIYQTSTFRAYVALFVAATLLLLQSLELRAQNYYSLAAEIQLGNVWAHHPSLHYSEQASPISLQIRYAQTLRDSSFRALYHTQVQRGVVVNLTDYRLQQLGQTFAVAYYLQPTVNIYKRLSIGVAPAGGLSYSTNPYDKTKNQGNANYSTHLNAYFAFGTHVKILLTDRFQLSVAAQFNHISNGSIRKPNSGINWYTAGVGVEYELNRNKQPYWLPADIPKKPKWGADVTTFYAALKRDTVTARTFHVTGISVQYSRRGLLHGFGIGTELAYDQLFQTEAKRIGQAEVAPYLPSVFAGHEFLLGKVVFSQQFGIYLINIHKAYETTWYHRWGFVYYPLKKFGLGVNFKIHGFTANFADARLVYDLH